ncbi:Sugar phosphatase YfbT [termite gut metagenome]|uniref:Sugar phosphatase YfbT n=1 Tax=termite gut metagenome TaxID=433724 RepID=A0A5J4QE84_9ZZZZ
MFQQAVKHYLQATGYPYIKLKSVLFDMDGVLFDSMPYHADAWHKTMKARGLDLSYEEAYLHEGRTGAGTINIVCKRQWNREASPEEIEAIYHEKTIEFNKHPLAQRMPGTYELLSKIKATGVFSSVVTGSGQNSLLGQLEENYPGMFCPELMVTAFDVKYGKPNPEPYLMALSRGNRKANEAIVIENAPLGVEAGVKAGIFTIAVNTGPLADSILIEAGANLLFPSMQALADAWEELTLLFHIPFNIQT